MDFSFAVFWRSAKWVCRFADIEWNREIEISVTYQKVNPKYIKNLVCTPSPRPCCQSCYPPPPTRQSHSHVCHVLIRMFITIKQPKVGLFIQLIFHSLPYYLFIWCESSVNAQCCHFATPPFRLQLNIRPTDSTLIRQNMTQAEDQ